MRVSRFAVPLLVCALEGSATAQQVVTLTFADAIARARERAPAVLIARARIEEARGRLTGAQVSQRENPTLGGSIGPRWTSAGTLADFDFGISQVLEAGGQRLARIAGAEASVSREVATSEDVARIVVRDVAFAFIRTAHAQERLVLLAADEAAAGQMVDVANRRFLAGDIAVLDFNVARGTLARARAARMAADAERIAAAGDLQRLLALPQGSDLRVQGGMTMPSPPDLERLRAAVENRGDLRALKADVAEAEADVQLGKAVGRPDVGVGARIKHEEGNRAIVAELSVTLPMFNHGQELQATGLARASRLRMELENTRTLALAEVEITHAVYLMKRQALEALEADAIPLVDENQALAERSFEAGQISLPELLLVRRELVETRLEYLDRLREQAEAAILEQSLAGVLR